MKYLSDYMNDKQTEVFNKYGAFFAFSNKQFEEKKKDGVEYNNLGSGMIAPIENAMLIIEALECIYKESILLDIKENGIPAIIHRELGNHECQITNDIDEVTEALKDYGITEKQIQNEWDLFYTKCVQNDWF